MSEILSDLLEQAEDRLHPPPDPEFGIKKPWVPKWISTPVKCLMAPFVAIDYTMHRLARKIIKPPFRQEGACKQRGKCCHYVLIQYSRSPLGRLFYFWYTQFIGFYPRLKTPQDYDGKKVHVMGCSYLRKDGSCGQYRLRPLVCRQWPVIEHFGYPRILKGCGFRSNPPYPAETADNLEGDPRLNVIKD